MRIKILLFCGFSMCAKLLLAQPQYARCDSFTLFGGTYAPFNYEGIHTLDDLIKRRWPLLSDFIADRSELEGIPVWVNANNILFFSDNHSIEISISIDNRKFSPDAFFSEDGGSLNTKYVPHGITPKDTIISYIHEIKINSKLTDESAYKDLLNPNLFETIFSIRPIEVYKSACGQYIYLYIFGKLGPPSEFKLSYMAKLIFKTNGEYIGRIVERGKILIHFGFNNCPLFKGF